MSGRRALNIVYAMLYDELPSDKRDAFEEAIRRTPEDWAMWRTAQRQEQVAVALEVGEVG